MPAVLILNLFLTSYYDYSFTELKNFALKLKKSNAEEIIAFDMFQPLLVFYSGLHVNFKEKNKQLIYMEKAMNAGKNLYVIIPKKYLKNDGLLTKKHQKLFKALTIIDSGRRHVLCKLTANS